MGPNDVASPVGGAFRAGGCPRLTGYDALNEQQLRNPFPLLERARRELPVFYDETNRSWCITRYEDILTVLRDERSFTAAGLAVRPVPAALRERMPEYLWADTLVNLDPPQHTPVREVIQAPFRPGHIRPVEPVAREIARGLVRRAKPHGGMDFPDDFAFPFSFKVLSTILGISEEDFPLILQGVNAVFAIISGALQEEAELACATQVAELTDWLREFVDYRRKHPGDDYCSIMIAAKDAEGGNRDDNDEVAGHMFTLVAAGFETTALMLTDIFYTLLENPERWEQLVANPDLAPRAVEEAFRLRPAVKEVYRTTTRPVLIGSTSIPAGERVALVLPPPTVTRMSMCTQIPTTWTVKPRPHTSGWDGGPTFVSAHRWPGLTDGLPSKHSSKECLTSDYWQTRKSHSAATRGCSPLNTSTSPGRCDPS